MIVRKPDLVREFEREQIRRSAPNFHENLWIFEELFKEAWSLGAFPLRDPLEGIENDIKLARTLNSAPRS